MARKAELRTERLIEGKKPPELPSVAKSLRDYSSECVGPAMDDWEAAAGRSKAPHGMFHAVFFWMRHLKRHPKLLKATAREAADTIVALFHAVPDVADLVNREVLDLENPDSLHSFVYNRWDDIKHLPGESPWSNAIDSVRNGYAMQFPTKALTAMHCPGSRADNEDRRHFMQTGTFRMDLIGYGQKIKRPSIAECVRNGEMIDAWDSSREPMEPCFVLPHEAGRTPTHGMFLLSLIALRDAFKATNPGKEHHEIVIGTDDIGNRLKVCGRTIWDYRSELEKLEILTEITPGKFGKAGVYVLNYRHLVHQIWLNRQRNQVFRERPPISID